jgi:geranylgeranyl diphosphate synthase type I
MSLVQEMLPAVEQELREAVQRCGSRLGSDLSEMLTYHMGWSGPGAGLAATGKRIRPILTLLACGGVCGDWRRALPVAAAVEFIHNFSLVHDDIQDESPTRRGRETIWKRWGAAQAINAGDALFAAASLAILESEHGALASATRAEVLLVLSRACLELTHGQFLDLKAEDVAQASLDFYWQMVMAKTGALVAAACRAGGLAGGASAPQADTLADFGLHLGLAFQVRDDVLGLWGDPAVTGKSATTDLESRKKSLPIVFGLERCTEFRALLAEPFTAAQVPRMLAALETCGARTFALAEGARMTERAYAAIGGAALRPEYDSALRELTASLLTREK